MARKTLDQLGDLQRKVMDQVWDMGEASVHEVVARFDGGDARTPAYTTILTVMQKLEKAGWLEHERRGRVYVYRPVLTREQLGVRSILGTVRSLFSGDLRACMQQLISAQDLDAEDLAALRKIIDEAAKGDGHER